MFRAAAAAVLAVAAVPAVALAQPGPYLAVVADPEVRLRAGPSDQYPETGTLVRGTRLVVAREESNGWLAVDPPQGQVSWVPTQFIDGFDPSRPTPQRVVVASEGEVTLAAGAAGTPQPLDIRKVRVPNGTILTVTGPRATHDGKSWYPVAPPAGDHRYLPKSAVQFDRPVNTSYVVRDAAPLPPAEAGTTPAAPPASGTVQPVAGAAPAAKPAVGHPLWAQAEAAEAGGKYDDAERLYFELARVMNAPGGDHDVANLCYTRIHALREKKRVGPVAVAVGPGSPGWAPAKDDRPTLLPPSSGSSPVSLPTATRPTTPAPQPQPQPANASADDKPRWAGPGVLTRSALALDGRKTYALESSPGVVRVYVVGAPGVDLDKYVNQRIDVYGLSQSRRDLSKPYVVATTVEMVVARP